MKCYLINLDRSPDRLARMDQLLTSLGILYERVSAIDARTFTSEELARYHKQRPNGKPLNQGDIACGATHLSVLKKIADGTDKYAVVMEDDLYFVEDVSILLKSSKWIPSDADIVKLETCNQFTALGKRKIKIQEGRYASRLLGRHWGAAIYIISKDAAQEVLSAFTAGMDCIDNHMFGENSSIYKVYQVHPAVGVQGSVYMPENEILTSDIRPYIPAEISKNAMPATKAKGLRKIKRELLRAKTKMIDGAIFSWFYVVKGKIRTRIKFM